MSLMMAFILFLGLGVVYLCDPIWRRQNVSGSDAFSGMWLVASIILLFNPSAWQYLTWPGVICILITHIVFATGRTMGLLRWRRSSNKPIRQILLRGPYLRNYSIYLFYALIPIAIFGVFGTFISTGGFTPMCDDSIVEMRGQLHRGELQIPVLYRLCANLMYPALLIGAFAATRGGRWRLWGRFIAIPLLCPLVYSFSMGGKGCLIISALFVIWTVLLTKGLRGALGPLTIIFGVVIAFSVFIHYTRPEVANVLTTLNIYVYGPLVAFGQYLKEHYRFEWYNTRFEELAIVREISKVFGASVLRSIDIKTVNIPNPYNAFTCIPDWLEAFGVLGSTLLVFSIGIGCGLAEARGYSKNMMIRVVLYAYLSSALFADVSFLMIGWWICLLVALFNDVSVRILPT